MQPPGSRKGVNSLQGSHNYVMRARYHHLLQLCVAAYSPLGFPTAKCRDEGLR